MGMKDLVQSGSGAVLGVLLAAGVFLGGGSSATGVDEVKAEDVGEQVYKVTVPPAALNLDPFYKKYISAKGYPIVSSDKVSDYALYEATYLVNMMLAQREDVRQAMMTCPR